MNRDKCTKLDFEILDEGTLIVHLISKDVSELKGIVKTLTEMEKAISDVNEAAFPTLSTQMRSPQAGDPQIV